MAICSKAYPFDETNIITLDQAKANLKIDGTDEDALIQLIIQAAYQSVESFINRIMLNCTIIYQVNHTGNSFTITLTEPQTFKQVSSLVAIATDGTEVAVTSKTTTLNGNCIEFSNIVLDEQKNVNAYRLGITYAPKLLDYALNAAVYLQITHLYENRNAVVVGTSAKELPLGIKSLLGPYKFYAI